MAKARIQVGEDRATDLALAALRRQLGFWLVAAAVFALFIYVFSDILLPFVAGMVLAYFLDPVADRLQRIGLSRFAATILILIAFVIVLVLALVILIPVLATQLSDFIARMPSYLS
ncbi:AI-2E family transporter, partial [Rhizobiaceae sp. 2RAB30]